MRCGSVYVYWIELAKQAELRDCRIFTGFELHKFRLLKGCVLFCLLAACLFTAERACAEGSVSETERVGQIPKRLSIPLLYMTDRRRSRFGYANTRKSESISINDVFCGKVECPITNYKKKELTSARSSLGWTALSRPGRMVCHMPDYPSEILEPFGEAIADSLRKSGAKDVFVFVHGYNNSFASAAESAARLSYELEVPVILYSWPSSDRLLQYFVDTGNNEWSQEHFNRFIEMLGWLKQKYGFSINFVAHSMGNRLLVRSAPVLVKKEILSRVFLVDPDFDSETFINYTSRYRNQKSFDKDGILRVLFSHRDNALPVAQKIFGGYTRLGQGADTIFESFFKPKQLLPVLYYKAKEGWALSTLEHKDLGNGAIRDMFNMRLEWIDFTIMDHGLIGHTIPFELIGSLSRSSSPGPGFSIVPVEVGLSTLKNKSLAGFLRKENIGEDFGTCLRVERCQKENSRK